MSVTKVDSINNDLQQASIYTKKAGNSKISQIVSGVLFGLGAVLFFVGLTGGGHHIYAAVEMVGFWLGAPGLTSLAVSTFVKRYFLKQADNLQKGITDKRLSDMVSDEPDMEKIKKLVPLLNKNQLETLQSLLPDENLEVPKTTSEKNPLLE